MYPKVKDPEMVGEYPAQAKAGGGYVWDEVLEYRVWCQDETEGDYYYAFDEAEDALEYSHNHDLAEKPLALILQREYIDEPISGEYVHIREERITEWPLEFLSRPRRTERTIPDFLSPDAPGNRLDILRGVAERY